MTRVAFIMQLNKGCEEEYKRRHDALWPELNELLKLTGISDYSIFLHPATNQLFATMKVENVVKLKDLSNELVMKKWWNYMEDIMETNLDKSPSSLPLHEVFYLP
jgi:L-rhamnose mutarotase